MNTVPLYQVDAFTSVPFHGNPAAVCLVPEMLEDVLMRAIAAEMNLSETAFVTRLEPGAWSEAATFSLRWFTPQVEVPLCGHATLATAAVLFDVVQVAASSVTFETLSGDLIARRTPDGIELDFPVDVPEEAQAPAGVLAALHDPPVNAVAYGARTKKLLIELDDVDAVRALAPDFATLRAAADIERVRGLIVTAAGEPPYDFVSRYFAPWVGIDEDPVTGSAHTVLAPYWAAKLGRDEFRAYQASARGGELSVRLGDNDRVELVGHAVVVMHGDLVF